MSGGGSIGSPLEALVFNCGTAGISLGLLVNNLWTWVAVVTAAVSFWVKARPFKPDPAPNPPVPAHEISNARPSPNQCCEPGVNPVRSEPGRAASTSGRADDEDEPVERVTKGNKYYKAYHTQTHRSDDGDDLFSGKSAPGEDGGWEAGDWVVVEEWRSSAAERKGEMGWYRYQDRRVLDGSVVRLWDVTATARCRRRRSKWPSSLVGATRFNLDCN